MSEEYQRLKRAREQTMSQRFVSQPARHSARVTSVVKESVSGIVTGIVATLIEGGVEVALPVQRGTGVREGALVTLNGDLFDPTAPLTFGGIDYSDDPSAGNADDADLQVPTWAPPEKLSMILGPNRASLTIYWHAIEGQACGGYQPSIRRYVGGVPGGWTEPVGIVAHLGGIQQVQLGANFAPGETIDVQIRAFYPWAGGSFSVPSELRTFILAVDDISPGDASGLLGIIVSPGMLEARPSSGNLNDHFSFWQYDLSNSGSAGPPSETRISDGNLVIPLVAGTYYGAVTPISISGVAGGRFPGTGYTLLGAVEAAVPVTALLPPAPWLAPASLANASYLDNQNVAHGVISILLPSVPPYDYLAGGMYDHTEILMSSAEGRFFGAEMAFGVTNAYFECGFSTLWTVYLRGRNRNGVASSTLSPVATIALTPPGVPGSSYAPTFEQRALAIMVKFYMPDMALQVEIQRADDVAMTVNPKTLGTVSGMFFLDLDDALDGPPAGGVYPNRYYRVRGVNGAGYGPWSTVSGPFKIKALDGRNLVADSITATEIAALTITGAELSAALTITSLLKTASSGARWELEGHTGGATQDRLRFLDAASLELLRLDPSGLIVFGSSAQQDVRMFRDGSGRGHFTAHNIDIGSNLMTISAMNAAILRFSGGATGDFDIRGVDYNGVANVGVYAQVNATDTAFGFRQGNKWIWVNGANNSSRPAIEFGTSSVPNFSMVNNASGEITFNGKLWVTNGVNITGTLANSTKGGSIYVSNANADNAIIGTKLTAILAVIGTAADNGYYGQLRVYAGSGLGYLTGSSTPSDEVWSSVSNGNRISKVGIFVNRYSSNNGGYGDTVYRQEFRVDNYGAVGGHVDIGNTYGGGYWALGRSGAQDIQWDGTNSRVQVPGNFRVDGTLTKAAGSFEIPHPDPARATTHLLKHSFVESPDRGGNLYRYSIAATDDTATYTLPLPAYFAHLNVLEGQGEDEHRPQVIVQADDLHWGEGRGKVNSAGTAVNLRLRGAGRYTVLVLATRTDPAARRSWDDQGGSEPLVRQKEEA